MDAKEMHDQLEKMTTEELKVIALEKGKYGNASKRAYMAQTIIHNRAGCPYRGTYFGSNHQRRTSSDYSYLS